MPRSDIMQKITNAPLYQAINLTDIELEEIDLILSGYSPNASIDIYCRECKQHSVFNPSDEGQLKANEAGTISYKLGKARIPYVCIHYRCSRDLDHYFAMTVFLFDDCLVKFGQYPSKADIEYPELERYEKVIDKGMLADFKRALGLSSHGIGAGAFVYLRRVIEYLVELAHIEKSSTDSFDEGEYNKSRFSEKIAILSDSLPKIIIENKEIYGILSKGVHELSEQECLDNFDVMKISILAIFDEILAKNEAAAKRMALKKSIDQTVSILGNRTS